MIYVGTDIVQISRIDKMIQEKGEHFLNHVFSCSEQDICNKKSSPIIHEMSLTAKARSYQPTLIKTAVSAATGSVLEVMRVLDSLVTMQCPCNCFNFLIFFTNVIFFRKI